MLSLTSAKSAALVGVFISVTTIPAAGNLALALVFGRFHDAAGSALHLVINLTGIVAAGYLVLLARGHSRVPDDRPSRHDTTWSTPACGRRILAAAGNKPVTAGPG